MDFVLKTIDFVLKMMDFVLKMLDFVDDQPGRTAVHVIFCAAVRDIELDRSPALYVLDSHYDHLVHVRNVRFILTKKR